MKVYCRPCDQVVDTVAPSALTSYETYPVHPGPDGKDCVMSMAIFTPPWSNGDK